MQGTQILVSSNNLTRPATTTNNLERVQHVRLWVGKTIHLTKASDQSLTDSS